MLRSTLLRAAAGLGLALAACSTVGSRVPSDLPVAPTPTAADEVATWVGALLSADRTASAAAGCWLSNLDAPHRQAFVDHAKRIPAERDSRWRAVLEEAGLLGEVGTEERIDLLVWRATRPCPVEVLKAQNGLLDLARQDPTPLLARLSRTGPGRDAIAIALASAGERRAVPMLLDLYRTSASAVERRAAASALARLAGRDLAPHADGSPDERSADATRTAAWFEENGGTPDAHR